MRDYFRNTETQRRGGHLPTGIKIGDLLYFIRVWLKLSIIKFVISREFRQVLAWLVDKSIIYYKICHPEGVGTGGAYDEGTFSSYYKRYSPADEEKDCLSRWRSCVMVVYGLKDYFSSHTLPRNDMGLGLDAGSAAILKSSLRYISILQKISRLEFFIYKAILGLMLLMLHELSCNSEHSDKNPSRGIFPQHPRILNSSLALDALPTPFILCQNNLYQLQCKTK